MQITRNNGIGLLNFISFFSSTLIISGMKLIEIMWKDFSKYLWSTQERNILSGNPSYINSYTRSLMEKIPASKIFLYYLWFHAKKGRFTPLLPLPTPSTSKKKEKEEKTTTLEELITFLLPPPPSVFVV